MLQEPVAVENEFLLSLYDCIKNFNISEDLRDSLLIKLNKTSENLIPIDMYSGTIWQPISSNDSNEEGYAQGSTPINCGEYDSLKDIKLQADLKTFHLATNEGKEHSTSRTIPDNWWI